MPSSYASTSSAEIIRTTSPHSGRPLATDSANMGSSATSGPVAERYVSSLTKQSSVDDLCRKHGVPKSYRPRLAGNRRACTPPPEGAVCVYAHALEAGMRLPLHGFFSETLTHFGLAPCQLTPNGWRILAGFVVLCHDAGVPPSVAVFRHFFSLGTSARGWCFFLGQDTAGALFTGLPRLNNRWKESFFFLTSPDPWPCPVRWGEPPSLADPVLTRQQWGWVGKILGARVAHDAAVDLRTYLSEANLAAAFSSSFGGESPPPPASSRPTSTRAKVLGTDQSGKKVAASASRTEKVKTESGGNRSALSGKKRSREEPNSNGGPCHSELSSLPAAHSATCLSVPPGFDPKPRHLPVPDTNDVHGAAGEAALKVPSTHESMPQRASYASSYALELERKLSEQIVTRAELEKKLAVREAEVVALRGQLKQCKAEPENAEFAATLLQLLVFEEQVISRAEQALEEYKRLKGTNASRRI